jgi:hypothetical protein
VTTRAARKSFIIGHLTPHAATRNARLRVSLVTSSIYAYDVDGVADDIGRAFLMGRRAHHSLCFPSRLR